MSLSNDGPHATPFYHSLWMYHLPVFRLFSSLLGLSEPFFRGAQGFIEFHLTRFIVGVYDMATILLPVKTRGPGTEYTGADTEEGGQPCTDGNGMPKSKR
jgi:hypothetical protein